MSVFTYMFLWLCTFVYFVVERIFFSVIKFFFYPRETRTCTFIQLKNRWEKRFDLYIKEKSTMHFSFLLFHHFPCYYFIIIWCNIFMVAVSKAIIGKSPLLCFQECYLMGNINFIIQITKWLCFHRLIFTL